MAQTILETEDNSSKNDCRKDLWNDYAAFRSLCNKSVSEITAANPGIIVFPPAATGQRENDSHLFDYAGESGQKTFKLQTFNFAGQLSFPKDNHKNKKEQRHLIIHSRFDRKEKEDAGSNDNNFSDYFIKYMLSVVSTGYLQYPDSAVLDADGGFDLWPYLFPYALNRAVSKGIYREYVNRQYDEPFLKGALDVPRHIKSNMLNHTCRIAFSTREYAQDNKVTELIRHTIEYLSKNSCYSVILHSAFQSDAHCNTIRAVTPDYSEKKRSEIVAYNTLHPCNHPYYTEYTYLQQICLKILNHENAGIQRTKNDEQQTSGFLIDIARLWENFVGIVLQEKSRNTNSSSRISHPDNERQKNGMQLFSDGRITLYPDYIIRNGADTFVCDAKYKSFDLYSDYTRDDRFQVLAYMYRLNADVGMFLYPQKYDRAENSRDVSRENTLQGGEITDKPGSFLYALGIPVLQSGDYLLFSEYKQKYETILEQFIAENDGMDKLFS